MKLNKRKMKNFILLLLSVPICWVESSPAPQDFKTSALLLAGQIKEVADNGAAARDEKEFEFMGAKVHNDMAIGFGDAMKMTGRRRRRAIDSQVFGAGNSLSSESDYSTSDYSYESELLDSNEAASEEQRKKRAASQSSSSRSSSSRYQSSSSSSSSFSSASSSSSESDSR